METYNGQVKSPADAIILFEACRLGLLPRIQRRLSEKERQLIKSGSVFVWDEREAGMRRWTDGKSWSASRVSGSFLTYREMEGKRGGSTFPNSSSSSSVDKDGKEGSQDSDVNANDGPDGYRYKADGLMKQSFSITTTTGQHLHLISYHARSHPHAAQLQAPSTDPNLRHVHPAKGLYPESTIHDQHNLPAVTRSPMVGSPFTTSPQQHMGPNTQNYLRHQPPVPPPPPPSAQQAHPPAYSAWPPSPMSTPGSTYYHSPHYMGQPAYPRSSQPSTAFDRAPPPMSNPSWPPPPPAPHSHSSSPQQQHHQSPSYPPQPHPATHQARTSAPSPYASSPHHFGSNRSSEDRAAAATAAAASLPLPSSHPGGGARRGGSTDHHDAHKHPSPQLSLGTTSPHTSHSYQESPPTRANGVYAPAERRTPPSSASLGNTPKEATKMIPSIKALINRTPSPLSRHTIGASPGMMDGDARYRSFNGTPEHDSRPSSSGHRYGAPSMGGPMSEKMHFGEDMRAIRQLDRAFAA